MSQLNTGTVMRCYMQHEVNQEESEQDDVDRMIPQVSKEAVCEM